MNTTPRNDFANATGLLILRLGIGGFMALAHGVSKVEMMSEGKDIGNPIEIGNTLSLLLITVAEFLCAILVMLGLGTRYAAGVVAFAMAVAAFRVHASDPWTIGGAAQLFAAGEAPTWGSKEPALLYFFPFLALVFTGAGAYSIDAVLARRRRAGGD
jgi:putative oxidoreductase